MGSLWGREAASPGHGAEGLSAGGGGLSQAGQGRSWGLWGQIQQGSPRGRGGALGQFGAGAGVPPVAEGAGGFLWAEAAAHPGQTPGGAGTEGAAPASPAHPSRGRPPRGVGRCGAVPCRGAPAAAVRRDATPRGICPAPTGCVRGTTGSDPPPPASPLPLDPAPGCGSRSPGGTPAAGRGVKDHGAVVAVEPRVAPAAWETFLGGGREGGWSRTGAGRPPALEAKSRVGSPEAVPRLSGGIGLCVGNAGFAAMPHLGKGFLFFKMQNLVLWPEVVCAETVAGPAHPIPKGCRRCRGAAGGMGALGITTEHLARGSGQEETREGTGAVRRVRRGVSRRCLGQDGLVVTLTQVQRGSLGCPGARGWQGQGGAMSASPPSPASGFSAIAAET